MNTSRFALAALQFSFLVSGAFGQQDLTSGGASPLYVREEVDPLDPIEMEVYFEGQLVSTARPVASAAWTTRR